MTLVIATGKTWTPGETATPTKLNLTGVPAITAALGIFVGRKTASGPGPIEELTPAEARAEMGIATSLLNSNLATSIAVTQAGALSGDLVFNAANAPTVTLTPGTWLLLGSVAGRITAGSDDVWAQFYNATDGVAFGGGSSDQCSAGGGSERGTLNVVGVITVPAATNKAIYFKVFRAGATTLDVGSAAGPSGFMQAIKLYT